MFSSTIQCFKNEVEIKVQNLTFEMKSIKQRRTKIKSHPEKDVKISSKSHLDWNKRNFGFGIVGQRAISVQFFKIFGPHLNHEN